MARIEWHKGNKQHWDDALREAKNAATASHGNFCLLVQKLETDLRGRWAWNVDEGGLFPHRTAASGIAATITEAKRLAEKAARGLTRPRLKLVHVAA